MQSNKSDPFCKICSFTSQLLTTDHFCWALGTADIVIVSWCKWIVHYLHSALNDTPHWVCDPQPERQRPDAAKQHIDCFHVCFHCSVLPFRLHPDGGKMSLAYNHYEHKFSSHNDFPIIHSQLIVWQLWSVYNSVGLYHVALPLIP